MSDINLKEGYPDSLTDKEIKEEINKIRRYANGGGWRWELIIAANSMIQTGKAEIADRFGKRTFYIMLALTFLSLLFAAVAVKFAIKTDKTDAEWKEMEINILKEVEQNTKTR